MGEVVYEVNLEIQREYAAEYMAWLRTHSMEMLELDGFLSCTVSDFERVKEANEPQTVRKVVAYRVRSMRHLRDYFEAGAAKMRGQATSKFAGKFKAWRRVILPRERHENLAKAKSKL